jgi:hypothetical protein
MNTSRLIAHPTSDSRLEFEPTRLISSEIHAGLRHSKRCRANLMLPSIVQPLNSIFIEKLTVSPLVKSTVILTNRRSSAVFTRVLHWSQS